MKKNLAIFASGSGTNFINIYNNAGGNILLIYKLLKSHLDELGNLFCWVDPSQYNIKIMKYSKDTLKIKD